MINKRILVLATYPIKKPQHGGQKRVDAIVKLYEKTFAKVKFVGIFYGGFYARYSKDDITLKGEFRKRVEQSPFTGDIVSGEALSQDPQARKKLIKIIEQFKPDIIQIEQTFPYFGLKQVLEGLKVRPTIILSSHNVEGDMKEEMLAGMGVDAKTRSEIGASIRAVETDLSARSALTIAVTEADAVVHSKMGAQHVVVAPNGIAPLSAEADTKHWQDFKREQGITRLITFVGAAHPPNWNGFLNMVGTAVGFVPPDAKILLAGSIADYFVENIKEGSPAYNTFWQRVIPVGRLSENRLAGLVKTTDVLLLPIIEGGGSNLKTAEAILSGKKVVATSFAFRSYEQYLGLPNLFIADKPKEFTEAIVRALETPYIKPTTEQRQLSEKVTWKYALAPIRKELEKL